MSRHPDLDDLELLVLVAGTGSLGQAADLVGASQPNISRRMARLERAMGLSLLQRSPRGTVLTPTGKVVVEWATALLDASQHFTASLQTMREQRKAALRVAASMTIAEHLLPAWINRLHGRAPDVVVSLSVNNSTEVADAVESGRADLGLVESPTIRASLGRRRFGWDSLQVVVPPAHPWARRRAPLSATELAAAPLLVREEGSGTRETLDHALGRAGLKVTPALELASNAALTSSAVAGLAPAVLSGLALAGEVHAGRLVVVPLAELSLRRPLSLVWRRDEPLGPAAAEFARLRAATP